MTTPSNHIRIIASTFTLSASMYSSTVTLHVPSEVRHATLTTSPGTKFIDGSTSKTISGYITVCSNVLDPTVWTIQDMFPFSNGYADLTSLTVDTVGIRSTLYIKGHTESRGYISSIGAIVTPSFTQQGKVLAVTSDLRSTVDGLGNFYISSGPSNVTSTINGLGNFYISTAGILSTVGGLGSTYISTASLISTILSSNYLVRSNLTSTVDSLGSLYISSASLVSTVIGLSNTYVTSNANQSTVIGLGRLEEDSLVSTVKNLGSLYISSSTLQSTVDGLGRYYISSAQLKSFVGNFTEGIAAYLLTEMVTNLGSNYISSTQLTSTVRGLQIDVSSNVDHLGYISTTQLFSTVEGLGSLPLESAYISSASLQSTVGSLRRSQTSNLVSTVAGLGTYYLSSGHLVSTVTGVSNVYSSNLVSTFTNLGSATYISTAQLVSTVEGLGSLFGDAAYISTASLVSTTDGYVKLGLQTLVDTAGQTYYSTTGLTSTTTGLLATFSNDLLSTATGLGTFYISTAHFTSTVGGLGSLPGGAAYISVASLVSSAVGYQNSGLQRLVDTAGQTYYSTTGLTSTTTGLLATFSNDLMSTATGLGTFYISSHHLTSTVDGLGSLPGGAAYISVASLVSSAVGYQNTGLQRLVDTAGQTYYSTTGLTSTTTGLLATFSNDLISTAIGLGTYYISTAHLTSTVGGLGSLPGGAAYISTASLLSTTAVLSNLGIQRVVDTAGQTYYSTTGLTSMTTSLLATFSNHLISTATGLGTFYISTPHLTSTVEGLGSLPGLGGYISTASLVSTYLGYTNFEQLQLTGMVNSLGNTYISSTGLVSTTTGLQLDFSNRFMSTLRGLGSAGYISRDALITQVDSLTDYATTPFLITNLTNATTAAESGLLTTLIQDARTFYATRDTLTTTTTSLLASFSNTYLSTLDGLGTSQYISLAQLTNTIGLLTANFLSNSQLTSTLTGYSNASASNLRILVNTAGQTYYSTTGLTSTTTGLLAFSNQLISTVTGLGTSGYISVTQLTSTVRGLGWLYLSTPSLASTLTSLSNIFAATAIPLFEDSLGTTYMSTGGIVSTIVGLSNSYITRPNLVSTVTSLGNSYISTPSLTSTITGIDLLQSNSMRQILISTVGGLGQTYLSTLQLESVITVTDLPALLTKVGAVGYSNSVNMFSNGYVYYNGAFTLAATSNFYEGSNLSVVTLPMSISGSTITGVVRTIGYGNNYIYGDGTYLTITSDRRLKDQIQPLSSADALQQVTSLQGVYYKKRDDLRSYIGCIAQEVEPVFPQVITTHPSIEPKDLKSMKYEFLLAPLVESVKELGYIHSTLKYFIQKNHSNIQ